MLTVDAEDRPKADRIFLVIKGRVTRSLEVIADQQDIQQSGNAMKPIGVDKSNVEAN